MVAVSTGGQLFCPPVHRTTGPPVPTKKSLAGQPPFPRLVNCTVSPRLLDTVRQRYSVDACAPTFRVAAARLSHCEQVHLTDGIPEDYTSQLSACSHLPWHPSCQLFFPQKQFVLRTGSAIGTTKKSPVFSSGQ